MQIDNQNTRPQRLWAAAATARRSYPQLNKSSWVDRTTFESPTPKDWKPAPTRDGLGQRRRLRGEAGLLDAAGRADTGGRIRARAHIVHAVVHAGRLAAPAQHRHEQSQQRTTQAVQGVNLPDDGGRACGGAAAAAFAVACSECLAAPAQNVVKTTDSDVRSGIAVTNISCRRRPRRRSHCKPHRDFQQAKGPGTIRSRLAEYS